MGFVGEALPYALAAGKVYQGVDQYKEGKRDRRFNRQYKQGQLDQAGRDDETRRYLSDNELTGKQQQFYGTEAGRFGGMFSDPSSTADPAQREAAMGTYGQLFGAATGGPRPDPGSLFGGVRSGVNPGQVSGVSGSSGTQPLGFGPGAFGLRENLEGAFASPAPAEDPMAQLTQQFAFGGGNPLTQAPEALRLKNEGLRLGNAHTQAQTRTEGFRGDGMEEDNFINRETREDRLTAPGLANSLSRSQAAQNEAQTEGTRQTTRQDAELFPFKRTGAILDNEGKVYANDLGRTNRDKGQMELRPDPSHKQGQSLFEQDLRGGLRKTLAQATESEATGQFLGQSIKPRIAEINSRTERNKAEGAATASRAATAKEQARISAGFLGLGRARLDFDKGKDLRDQPLNAANIARAMAEVEKITNDNLIPPERQERISALKGELAGSGNAGFGSSPAREAEVVWQDLDRELKEASFIAQAQRSGLSKKRAEGVLREVAAGTPAKEILGSYKHALDTGKISRSDYLKAVDAISYLTGKVWPSINQTKPASKSGASGKGTSGSQPFGAPPNSLP